VYAEFSTKGTFPQAEGNAVEVGTAIEIRACWNHYSFIVNVIPLE
ncbi:uncharacterized protein METZ01_LOCUS407509, partial [marine metagenome]